MPTTTLVIARQLGGSPTKRFTQWGGKVCPIWLIPGSGQVIITDAPANVTTENQPNANT